MTKTFDENNRMKILDRQCLKEGIFQSLCDCRNKLVLELSS